MTFAEKVEQLREKRSIALSSRVNITIAEIEEQEHDDFDNKYLWGEGSDIGIQDLIKLYYQERNLERGRNYTSPSIANYTKGFWDNRLSQALDIYGDGATGFYPPDGVGIAAETMNYNTPWLNNNDDDGVTNVGIEYLISTIDAAIGEDAFDADNNRTDGVDYGSLLAAATAGAARALADGGSGLRGRRTENSEVSPWGASPPFQYMVGTGGVDDSTYHDNPEKQALLDAIDALIAEINSASFYQVKLTEIYDEIDDIKTGTNTLFDETNMKADVDDDRSAITTLKSNLDTWVGDSGDAVGAGTLWGYRNWFAGAVGGSGSYNTYLTALETLAVTTIGGAINTRFNNVNTLLGDGAPVFTKIKKWRSFWIGTRILKPDASLITLEALQFASGNSFENLKIVDDQLVILFGSDYEKYVPTPEMITSFPKHKRDEETSVITKYRIGIAYIGQAHATEYLIFRRELSAVSIDNTDWGDAIYATFTTVNPNTGLIKNVFVDEDVNLDAGQSYCYRVRTRDTQITSPHDNYLGQQTGSVESKIYEDTEEKTFTSITNSKIDLGADHGISSGKYVAIKDTSSSDGFYLVTKVNEEIITVSPVIASAGAGKLYPANSVIFI